MAPAGTVTLAGTESAGLSVFRAMVAPAGGGKLKVRVHEDDLPDVTDVGEQTREVRVGCERIWRVTFWVVPLSVAVTMAV